MTAVLKFKGAVSGSLADPNAVGVQRKPVEELGKYIERVLEALDKGEELKGTFFDSNTPHQPIVVKKRTETHKVVEVYYVGGEPHITVEFSDTTPGKIAKGYSHMMGLEPVLRVEEGKEPSFDLVLSFDKWGSRSLEKRNG